MSTRALTVTAHVLEVNAFDFTPPGGARFVGTNVLLRICNRDIKAKLEPGVKLNVGDDQELEIALEAKDKLCQIVVVGVL